MQDRKAHDVRQVGGRAEGDCRRCPLLVDQQVDLFEARNVEIGDVGGRAHPCGVGQVALPVVRRAGAAGVREVVYLATPRCEVVGQQFGDPVQSAEIVVDASFDRKQTVGAVGSLGPSFGQRIGQKALGRGSQFGQQLVGLVPVRSDSSAVRRSVARRVHPVGEAEALQKGPYAPFMLSREPQSGKNVTKGRCCKMAKTVPWKEWLRTQRAEAMDSSHASMVRSP